VGIAGFLQNRLSFPSPVAQDRAKPVVGDRLEVDLRE
jgi:hypothetical protein